MEADQDIPKTPEPLHLLSVMDVRVLQTKPRTLGQIAEVVQELMNSIVCVIWKPSRTVKRTADGQPKGRLYPYSSTFTKVANAQHAGIPMDLEHDATGRFYMSKKPWAFENDFPTTDTKSPGREFIAENKLKHVCMARFVMSESHGTENKSQEVEYAISVYRRADQLVYNQIDAERLWHITWFLPSLYRQMVDSGLKDAIIKVNELLRPKCVSIIQAQQQLNTLCPQLAAFFHCHEITIYLREPHSSADQYNLIATTLDPNQLTFTHSSDKSGGLTNYVIATQKMIWFHDLQNFNDPERCELIKSRYPDIFWADGAKLGKEAKKILKLPDYGPNPPLSFVAAPIFGIDNENGPKEMMGVIRACLGTNPFHFIDDEFDVFEIIAQEIGRWWKSIGHGIEQSKRADIWEALNKTLSAQHEVLRHIGDDSDISVQLAMDTINTLVKEPPFEMAIFRRGDDARKLQLLAKAARSRNLNTPLNAIIPFAELNLPKTARGFHIEPVERNASKIKKTASIEEQNLFVDMALVLSFAVMIDKKLYGVLDVGFLNENDFRFGKERILQFLELTARQLALFERVRTSVEAAQIAQANELQAYAAVTHQLRSPLLTATKRLRALLDQFGELNSPEITTIATVAGMVRKAYGVTATIQTIGNLIKNDSPTVPLSSTKVDSLRKLTLEICHNHRLLAPEQMKLQFVLEPPATWGEYHLIWNKNCAENSLDAVISNAFKYSNVGEVIQIIGRVESIFFAVQIISRGIILLPEDVKNCTLYEWRGEEAKKQEGAGIGLWVTNHYMLLQGGKLQIYPTNLNGETMFELLFQLRKP